MLRLKNIFYLGIITSALLLASCGGDDGAETQPAPSISGFTPTSGAIGATVTISGNNFSTTIANNQVKFGAINATVTAATATSITTTVPAGASTGKISVTVNGQTAISTNDFVIEVPVVITGFAPASGAAGSTVTITGSGFSSTLASNTAFINNFAATITAASSTSLTITVPAAATTGKVSVRVGNQNATSATDFTVLVPPTLTFFQPFSADIGATVTINGTNFSTTVAGNVVKFNGVAATVSAASATQLTVTVPAGATSGKVTVETNGFPAVTSDRNFVVFGVFTAKASLPKTWFLGVGFAIGDKGYIGSGSAAASATQEFWRYDPSANTWTQVANYPGNGRFGLIGFSVGSKGYAGLGVVSGNRQKDFYEYDPVANTWTRKADFAGTSRNVASAFVIGDKGYVGLGLEGPTKAKDFYEYNPATNVWTKKADFGGTARDNAIGFSIGNTGYITAGSNTSNVATNDLWAYNPTTDTWTQGPSGFGGGTTFGGVALVIGTTAYIHANPQGTWEFNAATNIWSQQAPLNPQRNYAQGFVIGNKGYIAGGNSQANIAQSDFYEFTPR
ncbi:MAG: hypothetical protein EBR30_17645 [Cytophagia bacterium]|nr:hypothetical protein [Cytophagia bacterium]